MLICGDSGGAGWNRHVVVKFLNNGVDDSATALEIYVGDRAEEGGTCGDVLVQTRTACTSLCSHSFPSASRMRPSALRPSLVHPVCRGPSGGPAEVS